LLAPEYALHLAAFEDDSSGLKILLEAGDHDLELQVLPFGTPLHVAIIYGYTDCVEILLAAGADIESLSPGELGYGRDTALTLAAREGQSAVAKLLWDHGAVREAKSTEWRLTALELAACRGFADLVSDLLAWWDGWDIKTRENALKLASRKWEPEVIRVLLSRIVFDQRVLDGALLGAADEKPIMPSEEFSRPPELTAADFASEGKAVRLLLNAGACADAQHPYWAQHAVHIATRSLARVEALKALLEHGANPDLRDPEGRTALFIAAGKVAKIKPSFAQVHHPEGIKMLLEHGASTMAHDHRGETPIHRVAHCGTCELSFSNFA
jgi:hypothetical protein